MEHLKTKTRIVSIQGTRSSILVEPKHGNMPKNGHIYNMLQLLKLESATRAQITKYFPKNASKILYVVKQNGFVVEREGKFHITGSGLLEMKKLKTLVIS